MDEYFTYHKKTLADGRVAEVVPLTYGRARLCVIDGIGSYSHGY
jgi:hypothetical protein